MYRFFQVLFCCISLHSFGQYWQQEVNYKIQVKLDDKSHMLSAYEEFEYINNSPNQLEYIYVHLWPNAYKNGETALAKQKYALGDKELRFGHDSIKGWIDSLDFKVNGLKVKWEYDPKHIDICKITLNNPLLPGQRMTVSTPFKVKIPSGEISRLGHIGQSYQITQWYPKPAVYDKNGWNQIPYLNQGEFYSEYGSFDVSITLPKNYIVGATGDLQNQDELDFLTKLAEKTAKESGGNPKKSGIREKNPIFPESSIEWKTLRYTQQNVHDFAWFADKRFKVLKGEVTLPHSKRKVTTWAMFTPSNDYVWRKSIEYINDGTYYYSLWNGDYPYNQVTAIDGTISAGGGMEYPNVTVIGNTPSFKDLEIVIVHEVGHNWFYGILGSNERVHGWMDEGLNTLNEMRYIQTKYPNNQYLSDQLFGGSFHFEDLDHKDGGDLGYRLISSLGEDQPLETHSADFTSMNYGIIMYQKTGLIFHYLKDYLGQEKFDQVMQTYFETWKFKHPQPEDISKVLEEASGKDLSWFFEDLIQTTNHIDFKVKKVKRGKMDSEVYIKNVGQVAGPMPVTVYSNGKGETKWLEPHDKHALKFNFIADSVIIDPSRNIPELNRGNNMWISTKLFHKNEPLKLEFLTGDHDRNNRNVFWIPALGFNSGDKVMLGATVHNFGVPFRKNNFLIAPMFSFGRKNVSGIAEFMHHYLPKKYVKLIRLGLSMKTFAISEDDSYSAASPYVYLKIGNRKASTHFSESLLFQGLYRNDKEFNWNINQAGGFVKYRADWDYPDFKLNYVMRLDYVNNLSNENEFLRADGEVNLSFNYTKKKEKSHLVQLRLFTGNYLMKKLSTYAMSTGFAFSRIEYFSYNYNLSGVNGAGDVFAEEYMFNRSNSGFFAQQHIANQGNFKMGGNLLTSNILSSANLYIESPIRSLGLFADVAFTNQTIYYNAGVGFRLAPVFAIYVPLIQSSNLDYLHSNFAERIRFTVRMNPLNMRLNLKELF